MTKTKLQFKKGGVMNEVARGKGFHVSFAVVPTMHSDCETALVKNNKFYILNGDWREQYLKIIPKGYKACKAFFDQNKAGNTNFWSN